jgi:hypothetical protein
MNRISLIETDNDAKRAIEIITELESELRDQKDALRSYCTHAGIVEHNGIAWGFHRYDGLGFHDVESFVEAVGVEWPKYCNVDNNKAKKLFKRFPELVSKKPFKRFLGKKI